MVPSSTSRARAWSRRRTSGSKVRYPTSCVNTCLNVSAGSDEPDTSEMTSAACSRSSEPRSSLCRPSDRGEQGDGNFPSDRGCSLEDHPVCRRQAIEARGEHVFHGGGHLDGPDGAPKLVGSGAPLERPRLVERAHALLKEERVAFRPLHEAILERPQPGIVAQQMAEEQG